MIICTEKDENFNLYKDKVKNRKVSFHIKDIFKDHWKNYKDKFKDRKRRPIIDKVVDKFFLCKSYGAYRTYSSYRIYKSVPMTLFYNCLIIKMIPFDF